MAEDRTRRLVFASGSRHAAPEQALTDGEPYFAVSNNLDLCFCRELCESLADYFKHCIAREPRDLRSHVRRIIAELQRGRSDDVFAALVDLFLVSGRRALLLRRRMLSIAKDALNDTQCALLVERLIAGLGPEEVPVVPGSVLSRGVLGTLDLVKPMSGKVDTIRDALQEARDYLEYSQVEEARLTLERAVLEDPLRVELHAELLAIYRSTRDSVHFAEIFRQLADGSNPVPDAWRDLAEFFQVPQ